jgi:hypothetical protein
VQRVRAAAAAIHAASEARAAAAPRAPAAPPSPLHAITAATAGAVAHLAHTMNDASGTLEAKWTALEGTTTQLQAQLFQATHASAEALGAYEGVDCRAASSTLWAHESAAAVVETEEALRLQVYAQVYAQLTAAAAGGGGAATGARYGAA